MTVKIELTPQVEAWLDTQASQLGRHPEDIIRQIIEERFVTELRTPIVKTAQERIEAMDALAEKNANLPSLPDSAFDRESIYVDAL